MSFADDRSRHDWMQGLFGWLLRARENGFIHLSSSRYPHATKTAPRPMASPLARWQATHGEEVANLRQENVGLDAFLRSLIVLLDGQRDRQALIEALQEAGVSVPDLGLTQAIDDGLRFLTEAALLIDTDCRRCT